MAEEIAAKLEGLGLVTIPTDVRKNGLPASPDVCCSVDEGAGSAPDMTMGSGAISVEHPTVRIRFRGAPDDQETPKASAEAALTGLAAVQAETLTASGSTSAFYHGIDPLQSVFKIAYDENHRYVFGFNAAVRKEPSA